jgi:hypothetical protein
MLKNDKDLDAWRGRADVAKRFAEVENTRGESAK